MKRPIEREDIVCESASKKRKVDENLSVNIISATPVHSFVLPPNGSGRRGEVQGGKRKLVTSPEILNLESELNSNKSDKNGRPSGKGNIFLFDEESIAQLLSRQIIV